MSENAKKHNVLIEDSVYQEVKKYCDINSLKFNEYISKLIKKGFDMERYGDTPFCSLNKEVEERNVNQNIPDIILNDALRRFKSQISIEKETGEVDLHTDNLEGVEITFPETINKPDYSMVVHKEDVTERNLEGPTGEIKEMVDFVDDITKKRKNVRKL